MLALYNDIRLLEEQRRRTITDLVTGLNQQTNVNAALVKLLAESELYSVVRTSNVAGEIMLVDPWC